MREETDRQATRGTIEHMSNGNIITTTLAVIGGVTLLHVALANLTKWAHRAYLTTHIGREYEVWRCVVKNRRDNHREQAAAELETMCRKHGMYRMAKFYGNMTSKLRQEDIDAFMEFYRTQDSMNRQRTPGRVNRDYL